MAQPGVLRPLLYKAWRESRTRFMLSAGTIALFCATVVLFNTQIQHNPEQVPHGFRAATYNEHVYHFVYSGTAKGLFALLALFIGLGGLTRERQRGTASFTLALPVTRTQIILSQIAVGWTEIIAMAAIPALLVPTLSTVVHQSYPVGVALHFALLWAAGGVLIFGLAYLPAVVFVGDYTALVVAFLAFFSVPLVSQTPAFVRYRPNFLMTMGEFGTMHWNLAHTLLLPSPMPWVRVLAFCGIGVVLVWAALTVSRRHDF